MVSACRGNTPAGWHQIEDILVICIWALIRLWSTVSSTLQDMYCDRPRTEKIPYRWRQLCLGVSPLGELAGVLLERVVPTQVGRPAIADGFHC